MELISGYKTKGCIKRSRARWYSEGEKNSKYFLNLEKRPFNSNTIRLLKKDNDTNITSDKDILNEGKHFYTELYKTSKRDFDKIYEEYFFPK